MRSGAAGLPRSLPTTASRATSSSWHPTGRGGLSRWFLGSVAEDVVRRSIVPVMLVRARKASEPELAEAYSVPASSNAVVV